MPEAATEILLAFLVACAALAAVVVVRPALVEARGGRAIAFVILVVFPVLALVFGTQVHLRHARSTAFCLSCHVMEPYGRSLLLDDRSYLPAAHYQENRVPRGEACFACHADYTLFGGVSDKARGFRHLAASLRGGVPTRLRLYEPYDNAQCLHCHDGGRSFEENEIHRSVRDPIRTGATSCLECHALVHAVDELPSLPTVPAEAMP